MTPGTRMWSEQPYTNPAGRAVVAEPVEDVAPQVVWPGEFGFSRHGITTMGTSPSVPKVLSMGSGETHITNRAMAGMSGLCVAWGRRYTSMRFPDGWNVLASNPAGDGWSWYVAECRDYDGSSPIEVTAEGTLAASVGIGYEQLAARWLWSGPGGVGGWRVAYAHEYAGSNVSPIEFMLDDPGGDSARFQMVMGQGSSTSVVPAAQGQWQSSSWIGYGSGSAMNMNPSTAVWYEGDQAAAMLDAPVPAGVWTQEGTSLYRPYAAVSLGFAWGA